MNKETIRRGQLRGSEIKKRMVETGIVTLEDLEQINEKVDIAIQEEKKQNYQSMPKPMDTKEQILLNCELQDEIRLIRKMTAKMDRKLSRNLFRLTKHGHRLGASNE